MKFNMRIISEKQTIPEIKKLLLSTNESDVQLAFDIIRKQKKQTLMELYSDELFNTFHTEICEAKELIRQMLSK